MDKKEVEKVYRTILWFHIKNSLLFINLFSIFLFAPALTYLVEFYRSGDFIWTVVSFALVGSLLALVTGLARTGNTVVGVYWLSSALDTYMNSYDFDFSLGLVQKVPEKRLREFFESIFRSMVHPFKEVTSKAKGILEQIESVRIKFADLSGTENNYVTTVNRLLDLMKPLKEAIDSLASSIQSLHAMVIQQQQSMKERKEEIDALLESMETVSDLSRRIEEVATFIEQVSRRTNLLALNASIEAARGEEEARFARVASEIRKLANQIQVQVRSINESLAFLKEFLKNSFSTGTVLSSTLEAISRDVSTMVDYSQDILSRTFSLGAYGRDFSTEMESFKKNYENVLSLKREIASLLEEFEKVVRELREIFSPKSHVSPFQITSLEKEAGKLKARYVALTAIRAIFMGMLLGAIYFFLRKYLISTPFLAPLFIILFANIAAVVISLINWNRHVKPLIDFVLGLADGTAAFDSGNESFAKGVSRWVDDFRKQMARYIEASNQWISTTYESVSGLKERLSGVLEYFEEQSKEIDKVKQSFEKVLQTLSETESEVSQMESLAESDLERISEVKANMEEFLKGLLKMVQQGSNIASNLESIGDVAELTMVLSLNATIESMHSGEKGRGFAVVAQEVRKLASSVHGASEKVLGVVKNIESVASELEKNGNSAREAFGSIEESIEKIMDKVSAIGSILEKTIGEWDRKREEIEKLPVAVEREVVSMNSLLSFFEELEDSAEQFKSLMEKFS